MICLTLWLILQIYEIWFPPSPPQQPSFTFSYYGRVGSQRYRLRRAPPSSPRPIVTSRSLNDLRDLQRHLDKREVQLSASSLSSEASSSEGGPDRGTTVRLLWLSMLRVKYFGYVLNIYVFIPKCRCCTATQHLKSSVCSCSWLLLLFLSLLDAEAAVEVVSVSPSHVVLNYSWSCVLHWFHGASHLPRKPYGTHSCTLSHSWPPAIKVYLGFILQHGAVE